MQFVEQVCDTVTVLHDGQILVEGSMEEVKKNPQVVDVYLGRGDKWRLKCETSINFMEALTA